MPAAEYEAVSVTTASGAWNGNNSLVKNGFLREVRVRPASATTEYDLRFVDGDDFEVYHRTGLQGEWVEPLVPSIPLRSFMTLYVENADADESFTFILYWDPK